MTTRRERNEQYDSSEYLDCLLEHAQDVDLSLPAIEIRIRQTDPEILLTDSAQLSAAVRQPILRVVQSGEQTPAVSAEPAVMSPSGLDEQAILRSIEAMHAATANDTSVYPIELMRKQGHDNETSTQNIAA